MVVTKTQNILTLGLLYHRDIKREMQDHSLQPILPCLPFERAVKTDGRRLPTKGCYKATGLSPPGLIRIGNLVESEGKVKFWRGLPAMFILGGINKKTAPIKGQVDISQMTSKLIYDGQ
jgi:hypothetical protein